MKLKNPFAFQWIEQENQRQLNKWGVQIHSPFVWLGITLEEFGELAKAINEWWFRGGNINEVRKEAIQVATLALKIAEMACAQEEKEVDEK